ncbi:TonB-dependent receptor [Marinoscillum sp.]|uniref:TonB-dependent receptor n=1 Tax=Marinoscillum sp. TaxID=2024838 RepID=UPI003BA8A236
MKYWLGVLALVNTVMLEGQTLTGVVYDQLNNEPLVGATISVDKTNTGTTTNANGRYSFEELEPGRISLVISYVGYRSVLVENVWLKAGKLTEQDVYLERSADDLDEVVVTAPRPMVDPGRISITEEQINRIAATYYDPARLIISSPDVAVANDQNNAISVRGLSPAYNVWKLEGAEIINPNHLSNAGTFLDQPTATGGGVNMLSAQMLDQSEFLYSTFDNRYGNSVGGIFNMNLKEGNDQERQYTAQASLIGFDLAAEGPFQQGGKVTYAANYRYSFTGLLTGFGVDFGGESIGFQDLSFDIATPVGNRSKLKIFGVGGLSYNNFDHQPLEESEVEKDRKDIYYNNKTAIIGANWETGFDKGKLRVSAAYSVADNDREETVYANDSDAQVDSERVTSKREVASLNAVSTQKLGNGELELGLMQNFYQNRYEGINQPTAFQSDVDFKQWLTRPYVKLEGALGQRLAGTAGFGASFTEGDYVLEPRLGLKLDVGAKNQVSLGVGVYSMLMNPYNYFHNAGYGELQLFSDPSDYGLLTNYRGTLAHDILGSDWSLHSEFFYYRFPEANSVSSTQTELAFTGGLSTNFKKDFGRSAYLNLGGSWFDSEIDVYESYYNTQYSFTLSSGKEWDLSNEAKKRKLSVDLRGMYQAGYRPHLGAPYLESNFTTIPANFIDQQPYLRFDLRVVWKRYHENRTTSIALDLQNVANIENFAYQYYDTFTDQWETQNQLGLIPILAYRVEW